MLSTEDYLHAWHSGVVGAMMSGAAGHRVLLDASPQYLLTVAAPVRIKAVAPHAKFVLIIRVWPFLVQIVNPDYRSMLGNEAGQSCSRLCV
jgi:hypothetical protein